MLAELEIKRQETIFKMQLAERESQMKVEVMQADAMIADEDRTFDRDIRVAEFAMKATDSKPSSALQDAIDRINERIDALEKQSDTEEVEPSEITTDKADEAGEQPSA